MVFLTKPTLVHVKLSMYQENQSPKYILFKAWIHCPLSAASLQRHCSHQPHEEAAAGPQRAEPEKGQYPRYQGHRRVLPDKNTQTSWARQSPAETEGGGGKPHVSAHEPGRAEEPLPHAEGQSEPVPRPPRAHYGWAGQACLPLRARQPQRVCICLVVFWILTTNRTHRWHFLLLSGVGKTEMARPCRLEFAQSCETAERLHGKKHFTR